MTTPVKTFDEFVVGFEALSEHVDMRKHFVKECGWTPGQFARIKHFAWFTAKVSIWKGGEELATEYLGCCAYKSPTEFFRELENDYFSDMVHNCADEIGDPDLQSAVAAWRLAMNSKERDATLAT